MVKRPFRLLPSFNALLARRPMNLVSSSFFAKRPYSDAHPPTDGVLLMTPPITRGRQPTLEERWWCSVSRTGPPLGGVEARLPGLPVAAPLAGWLPRSRSGVPVVAPGSRRCRGAHGLAAETPEAAR